MNEKEIELLESAIEGLRTCGEPDKRLIWTERLIRVIPKYITLIAEIERKDREIVTLKDSVADYQEYQKSDREDIERLERENKKAQVKGMKFERGVWAKFILMDERVKKYWEKIRCGRSEFSADDAASMTMEMMNDINKLQRVCDCAGKLANAIDKSNTSPDLPNTSIAIQLLTKELQQALRESEK